MSPKVITKQLYDDLKDSLGAAQITITDLRERLEATLAGKRLAERQAVQAQEHNLVLQSDRDRLVAALEVLTRRFASPTAETDPTRAGWRARNRQYSGQATDKYSTGVAGD